MKTIFAFTALASAALACSAQSSVTVYGIVDVGVTQVSGLKGGSLKQLNSGIMDGSRLGFRGNEDLGGGWRAIFTLEHRLEADTGGSSNRPPSGSQLPDRILTATSAASLGLPGLAQPAIAQVQALLGSSIGVNHNPATSAFWDRQAYVGLVTPVGAILAGRQYTPAYEVSATFDILQTQSPLAFGQVASFPPSIDIRVNNALQYRIVLGGLTASAMVAAAEGSTSTGRLMGAMAMYKGQGFAVGVGYNERENEKAVKSLTSTVIGGSVDIGPGTLGAMYAKVKDDAPTGVQNIAATLTPAFAALGPATAAAVANTIQNGFIRAVRQDAVAMHLGYKLTSGANTVYVAYNKFDDKRAVNADVASYGLVYSYALSKRTDINAAAVRFDNSATAQAAPGATGYLGGFTASAGTDSTSLALGVRHRF
jgi:predicted porin